MSKQLWEQMPSRFRYSDPETGEIIDPDAEVTLWRGDLLARASQGMSCAATENGYDVNDYTRRLSKDPRALSAAILDHLCQSYNSLFMSTSSYPRVAQLFANGDSSVPRSEETVYKLSLPAHHLVMAPPNFYKHKTARPTEVLAYGDIGHAAIKTYKTNNDDVTASELWVPEESRLLTFEDLERREEAFFDSGSLNQVGEWDTPPPFQREVAPEKTWKDKLLRLTQIIATGQ